MKRTTKVVGVRVPKCKKGMFVLKRLHQRIRQKAKDSKIEPVLIVAFGDSVTMGATALETFDFEAVYHNRLKRLLEKRYPKTVFSVINAGVGGETAAVSLSRLDRDVIRHRPDLVLVGFGLNDAGGGGVAGLEKFRFLLRKIIKKIQSKTDAEIVLLTPNFMNTSDNTNVADAHRKQGLPTKFAKCQNAGVPALYAETICCIGQEFNIPVADVYREWETLSACGMDTNLLLANGLNHPIPEAHRIPAELIMKHIDPGYRIKALNEFSAKTITIPAAADADCGGYNK